MRFLIGVIARIVVFRRRSARSRRSEIAKI